MIGVFLTMAPVLFILPLAFESILDLLDSLHTFLDMFFNIRFRRPGAGKFILIWRGFVEIYRSLHCLFAVFE